MDAGTWRGIFTVVMLVLFIGIWAWAWSGRRRKVFDDAARLPLEADEAINVAPERGARKPE
jgi:cytochrome c oxidase cbb3-type subunit 4